MRLSLGALSIPFVVALFSSSLNAARITEVADAMDENDPFDANIELQYDLRSHTATLTRENFQLDSDTNTNRVMRVKELKYQSTQHTVQPRLEIGLFRDLALYLKIPIVLSWNQNTLFADGTNASNSSLAQDRNNPDPPLVDGWQSDQDNLSKRRYNDWRFDPATGAYSSERGGPNNPTFGFRWSPSNNERRASSVTTTLDLSYTPPFFPYMDPWNEVADGTDQGNIANGIHLINFQVAMSKRFLFLDPYFVMHYSGPIPATESMMGLHGSHHGGFRTGMELIAHEDPAYDQRFAVDIFTGAQYFSEGRNYSEVSDLFNDITQVEQFMRTEAGAGLYFKAGPFVHFDLDFFFTYDTDHLVTNEDIGTDLDGSGFVDLDDSAKGEINQWYNPILDTPGRRIYVEESIGWQLMLHGGLTF